MDAGENKLHVTDEEYQEFRQILKGYRTPKKLGRSRRVNSCLVTDYLKENPRISRREGLQKILTDILTQLKESNEDYADLLKGRYWEGITVEGMVEAKRPKDVAPRTFYDDQKDAIHQFAYLFLEAERACERANLLLGEKRKAQEKAERQKLEQQRLQKEEAERRQQEEATQLAEQQRRQNLQKVLGISGAIIIIFILFLILRPFLFPPQPTATPPPIVISTSTTSPTPTELAPISLCGESKQIVLQSYGLFLPEQGVTSFTKDNTPGGILGNRVRAVAGTDRGVVIGYYGDIGTSGNGLSYYDRSEKPYYWVNCNESGTMVDRRVNDILVDSAGHIWVATDGIPGEKGGAFIFSDDEWHIYSIENSKFHTHATFEFDYDKTSNIIWLGTIDGLVRFYEDEDEWKVASSGECSNQIYTSAHESTGDIWLGHISQGISHLVNTTGAWECYSANDNEKRFDNNNIRGILVYPDQDSGQESLWFATEGGGVIKYEGGQWQTHHVSDGLPSDNLHAITADYYNRIWIATDKGVAYLQDEQWILYNSLNTWDIAFSHDANCLQDTGSCRRDDHVWTGTEENGLTHSRLPYPDPAINLIEICLRPENGDKICSSYDQEPYSAIVTETIILSPDEKFYFEITVSPQAGYELRQDRGDTFYFVTGQQAGICEWCVHFPVKEKDSTELAVSVGQRFTFSNNKDDNMLVAPPITNGKNEQIFVTAWRPWVHTRYAGSEIRIVIRVQQEIEE